MGEAAEVFFSYAHTDENLRLELEKHLAGLKRQGLISVWHDRMIQSGDEWPGVIDDHLNSASVILLLVSADFLASNYCHDVEVKRALDRHESGEARVVPIILRPVNWNGQPFANLQPLPRNGKPITTWKNRDQAFVSVAQGISSVIKDLHKPRRITSVEVVESEGEIGGPSRVAACVVAAETEEVDIELTINEDFNKFTSAQQRNLLSVIRKLLESDLPIRVVKKRPGSVKLTLRLRPQEAERLSWAVARGELDGLNVVAAVILGSKQGDSRQASQHLSTFTSHSVTNAIRAWQTGDQDAQYELNRLMRPLLTELIGTVRRKRADRFQGVIDSEEIVNKAFSSFLTGVQKNEFPELQNRENVRKLLFDMVGKALTQEVRRHLAKRRDRMREIAGGQEIQSLPAQPAEEISAFDDCLKNLQEKVRPVHEKAMDILECRIRGLSSQEIAQELDMGLRNVQRIIRLMREAWDEPDGADNI